jgi:NAD(P)-dependent dehydrogenase (short-subunit alcohol dehydrogenase family)
LRWAPVARERQVRVASVCPAPIDTPLLADFRKTMSDKVIDWNIAQAGGRLMSAREVATPLAFLGSDGASYISGVNLVVDGGFLAAMTTGQVDFSALA